MMRSHTKFNMWTLVFAGGAFGFVLVLNGAVPFLMLPTLGQAVWTMGFSESFLNESILSIYAHNFGMPQPAPIPFGLSGALVASVFVAVGMPSADAYAMMVALWLGVAFYGAYKIIIMFGGRSSLAIICALLWLSLPVSWAHRGYSMLSLGIALLPLYFYVTLQILNNKFSHQRPKIVLILKFALVCVVAVFMDGYSFVMFFFGTAIIVAYTFLTDSCLRRRMLTFSLPAYAGGFLLSALLYKLYIVSMGPETAHHIDLFRGMGLDLKFLFVPTFGMHWVWDVLGLSEIRNDRVYFGDGSVWSTTFSAPIIFSALIGYKLIRSKVALTTGLMLVAFLSIYLALGPSLKISSQKAVGDEFPQSIYERALMAPEYALAPTGSAWISKNVPGFSSMRAAYRWSALGVFCLWLVFAIYLISRNQGREKLESKSILSVALIIFLSIPNLGTTAHHSILNREMMYRLDDDLLPAMKAHVEENERIAFIPFRNDWLANYLAGKLKIRTYNIGGDKNLASAKAHWPMSMRLLSPESLDISSVGYMILLFADGNADAIIVPYVNFFMDAHKWPPSDAAIQESRNSNHSIIVALSKVAELEVLEEKYFAVVRPRNDALNVNSLRVAADEIRSNMENLGLTVEAWGPKSTRVGIVPNSQPGNNAGIWIKVKTEQGFGEVQLIFDGKPAVLTRFSGQTITAAISAENFKVAGEKPILIRQVLTGREFPVGAFLVAAD